MKIIRNTRTPIMRRAVEANGLVFVGGTIADDTSASMGEQTRNILGKIAGYLKAAGTDSSRVVSASIFVTDLSKKKEIDAAWTEFFGESLPARATVGVADLGGGALSRWWSLRSKAKHTDLLFKSSRGASVSFPCLRVEFSMRSFRPPSVVLSGATWCPLLGGLQGGDGFASTTFDASL